MVTVRILFAIIRYLSLCLIYVEQPGSNRQHTRTVQRFRAVPIRDKRGQFARSESLQKRDQRLLIRFREVQAEAMPLDRPRRAAIAFEPRRHVVVSKPA